MGIFFKKSSQHSTIWRWGVLKVRTGNRGRKWYQSIGILKLPGRPFSFFNFKGTPSWEEHKTVPSVFSTVGSASTGRDLFLRSSVSPYSCCTVPGVPVQLLYGERLCRTFSFAGRRLSTVTIISVQCTGTGPYSSCTVPTWHRTVAVQCRSCTAQRFYRFMMTKLAPVPDFKIVCMPTQMMY